MIITMSMMALCKNVFLRYIWEQNVYLDIYRLNYTSCSPEWRKESIFPQLGLKIPRIHASQILHKYLPWPAELYYFWTHHCILMGVKRHLIPLSICISLITGLSSLTFELPLLENAHLCSFKVYLLST